jgi:hypothetical protein
VKKWISLITERHNLKRPASPDLRVLTELGGLTAAARDIAGRKHGRLVDKNAIMNSSLLL